MTSTQTSPQTGSPTTQPRPRSTPGPATAGAPVPVEEAAWPVWVDDALVEAAQARTSALDHGFVVGDGVFETCKAVAGTPFALTLHLRRLARSAAGLGLPVPDEARVREAVAAVLAAAPAGSGQRARVRITWTGGLGPLGSERLPGSPATLVVAASPAAPSPATTRAATVAWTRNERAATAGLKTTSYAENVIALGVAHGRGASEALMANTRGELCEGTGSNVVVALGGELLTPPLSSGCLAGTTRALLVAWAREEGLPLREADVAWQDLASADEVLLTSSLRDVQHVEAVDDRPVAVGDLGRAAVELFARRAAQNDDPLLAGW